MIKTQVNIVGQISNGERPPLLGNRNRQTDPVDKSSRDKQAGMSGNIPDARLSRRDMPHPPRKNKNKFKRNSSSGRWDYLTVSPLFHYSNSFTGAGVFVKHYV